MRVRRFCRNVSRRAVAKQDVVNVLTMGHYHHMALRLSNNFFGSGEDGYCGYKITGDSNGTPEGLAALVDASGHEITYFDFGGVFAKEMLNQGTAAMLDFVVSDFKKAFVYMVELSIVKSDTFDWTKHALTQGAYLHLVRD